MAVNFTPASPSVVRCTVTSRTRTGSFAEPAWLPSTAATWLEVWVICPALQDASARADAAATVTSAPRRAAKFRDFTDSSSIGFKKFQDLSRKIWICCSQP
ncbi:hypothetical protein CGBL_0125990 [Corynebacterium glutamicum]|nr:hypothetical protein CGBL_0125990 [Corynebacterium glutamicum]